MLNLLKRLPRLTLATPLRTYHSTPLRQMRLKTEKRSTLQFTTRLTTLTTTPLPLPVIKHTLTADDVFPYMKHVVKSKKNHQRSWPREEMWKGERFNPNQVKRQVVLGKKMGVRHSPWRMNLLAQQIRQLPLPSALLQLQFSKKGQANTMREVLRKTANLASIRHGFQLEQLEVRECWITKGVHLKRIKFMGRGRTGMKQRMFCNINLKVGLIDFDSKIEKAETKGMVRKWTDMKAVADRVKEEARVELEELKELEKAAEAGAAK